MSTDDRDGSGGRDERTDPDELAPLQRRPTPMAVVTVAEFERRSHAINGPNADNEPTLPDATGPPPAADAAPSAAPAVDPTATAPATGELAVFKADLQLRAIGRAIDVAIFALLAESVSFVGPLVALGYLLLADALFDGTSVGKRLTRLRVVRTRDHKPANVFDSLLRNAPLSIAGLFVLIPLVGWALFLTLGLAILLFEGYLVWTDPRGIRAGDILAGTQVVDARRPLDGEK